MLLAIVLTALGAAAATAATFLLLARRRRASPETDFRAVVEATRVGVTVAKPGGLIVYVNPADAAMHGYSPADLIGLPSSVYGPPVSRKTVTTSELGVLRSWQREALNVRRDGEVFPVRLHTDVVRDAAGKAQAVVTLCEDVTDEKRLRDAQAAQSLHDPLTGLAHRAFFLDLVARAHRRAARHADYHFAVLYVDIGRFKLINESLGHDAGDTLLVALAKRLTGAIRPNDVAARIAGDEFALLLDGLRSPPDAVTVAERVLAALDAPFAVREREVYVTPNVGIAYGRAAAGDPEQYLRDARGAMHAARHAGQSLYGVFDEAVQRRATQRLQLDTDLRKAIEDGELRALYQPIVDLGSGATVGFEALVRWLHRARGVVLPGEFIPAAEETGLVVPIGWWMVETGSAQLAAWRRQFPDHPVTVSVNLSVRQLRQAGFCERIVAALKEAGAPLDGLKLEVTESVLLDDPDAQLATLSRLHDAGIGVVIDDFGTGYSSLSYLQRLDFDVLKIDRSFLPRDDTEEGWNLVRTIITLAHDRQARVVAEGVETEHHAVRLRELGCDWGQGYWFGRPLDPDAATARLRGERGS